MMQHGKVKVMISGRKKVQFEHANNVLSATAAYMQTFDYFAQFSSLAETSVTDTSLATVKPAVSPYLNGTNSKMLPILARTGFQLLSPMDMLE